MDDGSGWLAEALKARECFKAQDDEGALRHLDQAAALGANDSEVTLLRGLALLRQGRLAEGWPCFESRRTRWNSPIARSGLQEWSGEPLEGRSLVVWGEQGLGDEIQFARFLPKLRTLGVRWITAGVLPQNMRLFQALGADLVLPRTERQDVPVADYWICLASLPYRLGVRAPSDVPSAAYLSPRWIGGDDRIGIVWRGNPGNPNDKARSLPSPEPLLALPGAVGLEPAGDMLDSLEAIRRLRAIVTVDTSWAHLAGAIGAPCMVLLPHELTDWRWGLSAERSYWYDSLRLFRQSSPGDWAAAIAQIEAVLGA